MTSGVHPSELHDPGGKVRIRLPGLVAGGAEFSDCGRYRPLLWRSWTGAAMSGHVLFIGLNPSTATDDEDDPTVRRERDFTSRWGYGDYRKCNVMDYRATSPGDLISSGIEPRSGDNLAVILRQAKDASIVVAAFGAIDRRLKHFAQETLDMLHENGIDCVCLGTTRKGYPRHPLYLRKDTALRPYERRVLA